MTPTSTGHKSTVLAGLAEPRTACLQHGHAKQGLHHLVCIHAFGEQPAWSGVVVVHKRPVSVQG